MTETSDRSDVAAAKLPPALERFVLQWGDMGSTWGVNRSVSQIHALLYVSGRPMTAEEIAGTLGIARSNVSTSIRELMGWDLIRRVPMKGDRREHFEAEGDIWEIVSRIAAGRKAREFDPAIAALKACVAEADGDTAIDRRASQRVKDMLAFTEMVDTWYGQMRTVPRDKLAMLMKLGARIIKLLPGRK